MEDTRLAVGIIQKPHGVRGWVRVKSLSGEIDHLLSLKAVFFGSHSPEPLGIEAVREYTRGVLIKFSGIDDRDEAQKLQGTEIWVERRDACPLEADEFYVADLCRCSVWREGEQVGRVRSLIEGGATDILEVVLSNGSLTMIPFVEPYIREVDTGGKRIVVTGAVELL